MFQQIEPAQQDPILGLTEAFKNDQRPNKINLGVGIYQDAHGQTPTLPSVKAAAERVAAGMDSLAYRPMTGLASYNAAVQRLLLGDGHEATTSRRARTAQTPGGSGALRVVGDFLANSLPGVTVWISDPTWPNHAGIFSAAKVSLAKYPYFDKTHSRLAISEMLSALNEIPSGDAVLLHGCCHNPSGVDPTPEQWQEIAEVVVGRKLLPIVDFAYQGFGDGLHEDAIGLRALLQPEVEMIICSSFSKNFGLYSERTGAVTFISKQADIADRVESQVKRAIRANYSNPPSFGARVVATILDDASLRQQWEGELAEMRDRINGMRRLLSERLKAKGVPGDYSFITRQRGMFSFSGLTKEQVLRLREEFAIYVVDSGLINVAGLTEENVDRVVEAVAAVV